MEGVWCEGGVAWRGCGVEGVWCRGYELLNCMLVGRILIAVGLTHFPAAVSAWGVAGMEEVNLEDSSPSGLRCWGVAAMLAERRGAWPWMETGAEPSEAG